MSALWSTVAVPSPISAKQQQILTVIRQSIRERGYQPTVREIGQAVNLRSPSTVHMHLKTLESLGYIRRDPNKPRALEICEAVIGACYLGHGFELTAAEVDAISGLAEDDGRLFGGDPDTHEEM